LRVPHVFDPASRGAGAPSRPHHEISLDRAPVRRDRELPSREPAQAALRSPAEPTRQLNALRADPEFQKLIVRAAAEVMRTWSVSRQNANQIVISAVGEPRTLASVHGAWFAARANATGTGLVTVIIRRRVLDLMRSDARRPRHESLPPTIEQLDDALRARAPQDGRLPQDPHALAERRAIVDGVRTALHSFAEQGPRQERQARLVRRHAIDEASHSDLARQLACSPTALRVRIHKAMRALRRHIETCHPELGDLLERGPTAGSARSADSRSHSQP
jgi:DNA-directed RNA polymerase specialized sigma24 family protein